MLSVGCRFFIKLFTVRNNMTVFTVSTMIIIMLKFIGKVHSEEIEYYESQNLAEHTNEINFAKKESTVLKFVTTKKENHYKNRALIKLTMRHYNISNSNNCVNRHKRKVYPVFQGHPKTTEELWNERFLNRSIGFDQTASLIKLIHNITLSYLNECIPVLLYDDQVKSENSNLLQNLFINFPVSYIHGYIKEDRHLIEPKLLVPKRHCQNYILFLTDLKESAEILGKQSRNKVVLVARSSQWTVHQFLSDKLSRNFLNLLVICQSFQDEGQNVLESPYVLYTHKLYTDGLGGSNPVVLTSWSKGKYSRNVDLFPPKMIEGYAGHRFVVAAAHQPPFVIRRIKTDLDGGNPSVVWDGIEIRILRLLAKRNNFSVEIIEPKELHLGPGDAITSELTSGRADIGVSGMYITADRLDVMDLTIAHSHDCASFLTLMSTALPRYRAILGPFHWHVWVALTFTYLIGIFPLAFSDKHTLRHLINNTGEVENMFWYVFGTFTNCFTFVGENSWSKTTKVTTRLLIGWYWLFTIIITSCYTGSIIAFVTLPVFPETVDTIQQLLSGFYRIGTLDKGGWERWFYNSSDSDTNKLLKKMELIPNVQSGIRNTTRAFFWPYAFLGSKAELEYIVRTNFSNIESKRAQLHISNECFVRFGIAMAFPSNSLYSARLTDDVNRMVQCGILKKIAGEVRWDMQSDNGRHLAAGTGTLKVSLVEEKGLTLEDTQGMFLLLGAGFLIAATALLSEWMGGFSRRCCSARSKNKEIHIKRDSSQINPTNNDIPDWDRVSDFDTRSSTSRSRATLEGQIIYVTEEGLTIHQNGIHEREDLRSSPSDVDGETQKTFQRDLHNRIYCTGNISQSNKKRQATASKGVFGEYLTSP